MQPTPRFRFTSIPFPLVLRAILVLALFGSMMPRAWGEEAPEPKAPPNAAELVQNLAKAVAEKNEPKRNQIFIKLRILGTPAVEPLLGLLKDPRPGVAPYAAFTLGWLNDARAADPLTGCVRQDDPDLKRAAMRALGNLQAKQALPIIKEQLASEDRMVRVDAIYSLGLVRDPQANPWIEPFTQDKDEMIAFFAKEALERIKTGW